MTLPKRWVIVRRWTGVTSDGSQVTGLRYRSRRRAERRAVQMSAAVADRGIWCEVQQIDGGAALITALRTTQTDGSGAGGSMEP